MRLLHRLGPGPARLEGREFALVAGFVCSPERLHGLDPVLHDPKSGLEAGAVVLHLLRVPARTDTEVEAPAGDQIEARHRLGGNDGVALGDQANARAEAERAGHRRRGGEAHERIERVGIFLRQLAPAAPGRAPAGGDVGVLGHEERVEPSLLERRRKLGQRDAIIGGEDNGANLHGCVLPGRCLIAACVARRTLSRTAPRRNRLP